MTGQIQMMTEHQKIFAVLASACLVAVILAFVYKRKIKERYSWLWLLTGVIIFFVVVRYDVLVFITRLIGAYSTQTALFIFGMMFLILINIHFSMKISEFSNQIRSIVQTLAILQKEIEQLKERCGKKPPPTA
jgi:hypothetical protein